MVWIAIFYKWAIGLEGAIGAMNAQYYIIILSKGLLHRANDAMSELWTLK